MWGNVVSDGYFKNLSDDDMQSFKKLTAPGEKPSLLGFDENAENPPPNENSGVDGKKPTLQIDTSGFDYTSDS